MAEEDKKTEEIDLSQIPDQLPVEDVKGLKATLEKLREETKQLKAKASYAAELEATLGKISPEELRGLREAQKLQQQIEDVKAQIKSETEGRVRQEYEQKVAQLAEEKLNSDRQLKELKERTVISSIFSASGGQNLEDFLALASRRFQFDFVEDNGTLKLSNIRHANGQQIFEDGKLVTPEQVLFNARKGEYGATIAQCFTPFKQSSGGGYSSIGVTGSNGKTIIPRSEMSRFMQSADNRRRVISGEVEFSD